MKKFNTTGVCIPSKHYMVDMSDRLEQIKELVDGGSYFCINRARQYGKTTMLNAMKDVLSAEYEVLSLDFQGIGNAGFETEQSFVRAFCRKIKRESRIGLLLPTKISESLDDILSRKEDKAELDELFDVMLEWCCEAERRIVLMIDEVDSATNNQVFLDFLAQLREFYINRDTKGIDTFWSVILAGVTDVKHLKGKLRSDSEQKVNSPWNIAADFDIDMSLPESGIRGMLDEYEQDHNTGMDTADIAKQIHEYSNGYPFLVSRICQLVDEKLGDWEPEAFKDSKSCWTSYGVDEAVKMLLSESNNTLFESLTGKLINYPELKRSLRMILFRGETVAWLPYDEQQQQLYMYGFIRNEHNKVVLSNRIFEMLLYSHFIGENKANDELKQRASASRQSFVDDDGWLDIPKIMDHFIREHNRIHGRDDEKFLEDEGRERFITYVSAIINGTGTYSIEEQTRDHKRMDLVIRYLGRRYIIELKIWRGDRYNEKGERQIIDYLEYFHLKTGYMLSFNFNKTKKSGVERVTIGDKVLFEGTV